MIPPDPPRRFTSLAFIRLCLPPLPKFSKAYYDPVSSSSNFEQGYPCKQGWPDLPHSNTNLSNSHSPSPSIHGILLLQTNTFALLLHLCLPCLLWSSSLPLALLFTSNSNAFLTSVAHHPSSTHAHTISLHSPLLSEPLFPSIPTSPLGPLWSCTLYNIKKIQD